MAVTENPKIANSNFELNGIPSNLKNPEPGAARNKNQRNQCLLFPVITRSDLMGDLG